MNRFDAYPEPVPGGSYRIMLRFPKDGQAKPVLSGPEQPHIVPTKAEAWEECTRHILKWMNGNYRSESMGEDVSPADALFSSLKPIYRKGRQITVSNKHSGIKRRGA